MRRPRRMWGRDDRMILLLAAVAAFACAALSAVAGFGGGLLLLPVFVALFGVEAAIPVLTIAQLVSNGSRFWFNRKDVDRPVAVAFSVGAVPLAAAGALLFASVTVHSLQPLLGVAVLLMLVWRRRGPAVATPSARAFVGVGALSGFVSAIVGTVGPLAAPFFLARRLSRGAYIGTDALASLVMHGTKLALYGGAQLITLNVLAVGLLLAPSTAAGAWAGKKLVARMPERAFLVVVEVGLVVAAAALVITPWT